MRNPARFSFRQAGMLLLIVSAAGCKVTVPDVVNLPQLAAESALEAAGLFVGDVTGEYSATVTRGSVIAQEPVAGESVPRNAPVALVISGGPEPVIAPSVVEMSQSDAEAAILAAGLVVGTITEQYSDETPPGHVISQSPRGGASVAAGAAISLVVSRGPGEEMIEIQAIREDTTLSAGTYIAREDITVTNGAVLTLLPGVKIIFEQDKRMFVGIDGGLRAVGTSDSPILFTGADSARGYWGGLQLYNTNSVDNRLEHVTIEYGGGYYEGNLHVIGSANNPLRVAINHCVFRQSAGFGFVSSGVVVVDEFAGNTLTENEKGAANMNADHIAFLTAENSFADNDLDIVVIPSGNVTADAVWPGIDAFYVVATDLSVAAALTIGAGAVLEFEEDRKMQVEPWGSLAALGTEAAPVFFTGAEAVAGYWGGLRYYNSDNTGNVLRHTVCEYGGGFWDANVNLAGASATPCRVRVENCVFRHSSGYGLSTYDKVLIDSFSNNVLTSNEFGPALVRADHVGFLDAGSLFGGNKIDVVHVASGHVENPATWQAIDVPFFIDTKIDVTAALAIQPGTTLAFHAGYSMSVNEYGSLTATGTADAPVIFTGAEAVPGYWGGLRFYNSNSESNMLSYVKMEYGGGYFDANLYVTGSAANPSQIHAAHCAFENSAQWGVLIEGVVEANEDMGAVNSFADNAAGDIEGL